MVGIVYLIIAGILSLLFGGIFAFAGGEGVVAFIFICILITIGMAAGGDGNA